MKQHLPASNGSVYHKIGVWHWTSEIGDAKFASSQSIWNTIMLKGETADLLVYKHAIIWIITATPQKLLLVSIWIQPETKRSQTEHTCSISKITLS